jgi:hypothetical protein
MWNGGEGKLGAGSKKLDGGMVRIGVWVDRAVTLRAGRRVVWSAAAAADLHGDLWKERRGGEMRNAETGGGLCGCQRQLAKPHHQQR